MLFLESLGDKEVNYNHVNDLDSNLDDQKDHECPPSVFCKETGILLDICTWNPTYATFLESLGENEVNYNHVNDLDYNQDDQEDQECPPCVFCKEIGILMDFFTWNPTYDTFLESLGDREVNYYYVNDIDYNQDDQEDQECPPSVFC